MSTADRADRLTCAKEPVAEINGELANRKAPMTAIQWHKFFFPFFPTCTSYSDRSKIVDSKHLVLTELLKRPSY
jgi:hypothetical protein